MSSTLPPIPSVRPLAAAVRDPIAQSRLFARAADFVFLHTPVPALRDAALDKPLLGTLWAPHWPRLRDATEHDAVLFMSFLLACAALRIDVARAVEAVRLSVRPGRSMKQFLSERGLLHDADFERRWPGADARMDADAGEEPA